MNPIQAVASVFKNYWKFDGRARRSEYWWYQIVSGIFADVLLFATGAIDVFTDPNAPRDSPLLATPSRPTASSPTASSCS